MPLITLLVGVLLLLLALWLVQTYMPVPFKTPVLVVLVIIAVIWILTLIFPGFTSVRVR